MVLGPLIITIAGGTFIAERTFTAEVGALPILRLNPLRLILPGLLKGWWRRCQEGNPTVTVPPEF